MGPDHPISSHGLHPKYSTQTLNNMAIWYDIICFLSNYVFRGEEWNGEIKNCTLKKVGGRGDNGYSKLN